MHVLVWLARPSHLIAGALRAFAPRAVKWDGLASQTMHVQTRVYPEVDRETNELFGAISREGSAKPEYRIGLR